MLFATNPGGLDALGKRELRGAIAQSLDTARAPLPELNADTRDVAVGRKASPSIGPPADGVPRPPDSRPTHRNYPRAARAAPPAPPAPPPITPDGSAWASSLLAEANATHRIDYSLSSFATRPGAFGLLLGISSRESGDWHGLH